MKGFKDFSQKERQDMDSLNMALKFVQKQVEEKRARLEQLEKQVSRDRFNVRATKNQVQSYQEQIVVPTQSMPDMTGLNQ